MEACAAQLDAITPPRARIGVSLIEPRAYAAVAPAAVLSGRPYIPVYPKAPRERQRAIAAAAQCAAYLYDAQSESAAIALSGEFNGASLCVDPIKPSSRTGASDHGDHAYVMFTSGTTGRRKASQ